MADNYGYARGVARGAFAEGSGAPMQLSTGGEQITMNGMPMEAELARQGVGYYTVGSAVAPVAAIPTTGAHLSLYNGSTNNKSLVIVAVGAACVTTMAVAGQITLLARNDVPGANANPAGVIIIGATDGRMYSGQSNAKASVTLAAIGAGNNVGWIPAAASASAITTTTIGVNVHAEVQGRWIVRPGGLFSLATIAQTAAGANQPYIYFYEVQVPLP